MLTLLLLLIICSDMFTLFQLTTCWFAMHTVMTKLQYTYDTFLYVQVVSDATIAKVCESMVHSGKTYAAKHDSPSPLMYAYHKTEYLGGFCFLYKNYVASSCFLNCIFLYEICNDVYHSKNVSFGYLKSPLSQLLIWSLVCFALVAPDSTIL